MLLLEYKNTAPDPEIPVLKIVHSSEDVIAPDDIISDNPELENIEVTGEAKSILRFKPFTSHKETRKMAPAAGFRTGDFVTARVEGWPFLFHRGIIIVEDDGEVWIYHNTPMLKNRLGGGVVKEKLEDWVDSRDIMSVESTDMTKEYIQEKSTELAGRTYDTVFFNCEVYAFGLKEGRQRSPQVFWWGVGISVAGFIVYKILTRKKKNIGA